MQAPNLPDAEIYPAANLFSVMEDADAPWAPEKIVARLDDQAAKLRLLATET